MFPFQAILKKDHLSSLRPCPSLLSPRLSILHFLLSSSSLGICDQQRCGGARKQELNRKLLRSNFSPSRNSRILFLKSYRIPLIPSALSAPASFTNASILRSSLTLATDTFPLSTSHPLHFFFQLSALQREPRKLPALCDSLTLMKKGRRLTRAKSTVEAD